MTKQTGTIITIVVAVLTLCCSMTCCAGGILIAVDRGRMFDTYIESFWGIPACCLSILVLIVPLLLWLFLVRGKDNTEV